MYKVMYPDTEGNIEYTGFCFGKKYPEYGGKFDIINIAEYLPSHYEYIVLTTSINLVTLNQLNSE